MTKTIKKMRKQLTEIEYDQNYDTTLTPDYIYGYYINGELFYAGVGSDANASGEGQYKRARDFETHNDQCKANFINIEVKIEEHLTNGKDSKTLETLLIKANNLLEEGNIIQSVSDKKLYGAIINLIRTTGKEVDIGTMIQLSLRHAKGQNRTESMSLADRISSKIDYNDNHNLLVVSNGQFGGYNIIKSLINNSVQLNKIIVQGTKDFNTLTGEEELNKHNNLIINTRAGDFLQETFPNHNLDIIVGNPPWVGLGNKFINHAANLLPVGGRLVFIAGYNQFTDTKGRPGSFLDLQQRGSFEYIESFKGKTSRDYFYQDTGDAVGEWCWFIWHKTNVKLVTTIVNKLGEEFEYVLQGNEAFIPQLPNESDYFDWDAGAEMLYLTNKTRVIRDSGWCFKMTKSKIHKIWWVNMDSASGEAGLLVKGSWVDPDKFKDFFIKPAIDFHTLYAASKQSDVLRTPPIRKDLLI